MALTFCVGKRKKKETIWFVLKTLTMKSANGIFEQREEFTTNSGQNYSRLIRMTLMVVRYD